MQFVMLLAMGGTLSFVGDHSITGGANPPAPGRCGVDGRAKWVPLEISMLKTEGATSHPGLRRTHPELM